MSQSKKPTHDVFIVEDYGGDQSFWTKIGAAWTNSDGQGYNIQIKPGLAVSGKIAVRVVKDKKADA
jgi:hypothetical protein